MRTKEYWINQLGESWVNKLKPLLKSDYMESLMNKLERDYSINDMYPINQNDIFKPFRMCSWEKVKIVIIGSFPHQLNGLQSYPFASNERSNPTLSGTEIRNCLEKEYNSLSLDFDFTFEEWMRQGILMINRNLTCYQTNKNSHKEDWKKFFGTILYFIEKEKQGTIFLLWGKEVEKYCEILCLNHYVFSWTHPLTSALKFKQWNCPNFKQVDKLFETIYKKETKINWI